MSVFGSNEGKEEVIVGKDKMRRSGKEEKGYALLCVFCPREEKKEGTEEGGRKHCLICVGSKEEVTAL